MQITSMAQVVEMVPADATVDSTVTIYFDATEGDQGLMDFEGDVYAHTGVITLGSSNDRDWKYVVADWGTENEAVLMQREASNLYSIRFHIRNFYELPEDITVRKLAFVFRNADGSQTARSADGSDILLPLAAPNNWGYRYFTNTTSGLQVHTSGGVLVLRPYGKDIIRVQMLPEGLQPQPSHAAVQEPLQKPFQVDTSATRIKGTYGNLQAVVGKAPLQLKILRNDTLVHLQEFLAGNGGGGIMTFNLQDNERLMGGGARALPVNLRGHKLEFYNQAHYGYANGTPNLNTSIPLLTSSKHYALLFDNHAYARADVGKTRPGKIEYQAGSGDLRFFVIAPGDMEQLSKRIATLTGHAPMPPRWALGYIQSRYGYQSRQEAEDVVSRMRSNGFPMDALVLDLYWFGGTNRMGDFNWDRSQFPQPQEMMSNFEDKGIETILITEPYFTLESDLYQEAAELGHLAENADGGPFVLEGFWAGDAGLLDMTSQAARDWLWPHYKKLLDMGVSGLWTDLGEPESHPAEMQHEMGPAEQVHNLFNNFWARMIHDNFREEYPQKRLFNLTRAGYTGMQRYSAYPWSGDVQRSFSGLQAQIPIMLHMSMSGVGYMHSDLGGFTGGGQNAELYTRWLQLGAFSPVMRAHGTGVPPEPVFYDAATQDRVRKAIHMRYRFLPYNYTLAWKYSNHGIPPARPMDYYHPGNRELAGINDQFYWGRDLVVAPVLAEGARERMVQLPPGKWAHYQTGEIINGPGAVTAEAPMDAIPLFIRQGGFVVQTDERLMHVKAYNGDSARVRHVLPADGQTSTAEWYHDDGKTYGSYANSQYDRMTLKSETSGAVTSITLQQQADYLASPERRMQFSIYGLEDDAVNLHVAGQLVGIGDKKPENAPDIPHAWWDGKLLHVAFQWKDTTTNITIDRDGTVGVPHAKTAKQLKLHASPNPFSRHTRLDAYVSQTGRYMLRLYNSNGRQLANTGRHFKQGRTKIPFRGLFPQHASLQPGIYLIVMQGQGQSTRTRLVKSR